MVTKYVAHLGNDFLPVLVNILNGFLGLLLLVFLKLLNDFLVSAFHPELCDDGVILLANEVVNMNLLLHYLVNQVFYRMLDLCLLQNRLRLVQRVVPFVEDSVGAGLLRVVPLV